MNVLPIKDSPAENQYSGCGKAWVAVKNNEVQAIRYMGKFSFNSDDLPSWVVACLDVSYSLLDDPDVSYLGSKGLAELKDKAIEAGHPAFGPKGGHVRPTDIAREAHKVLREANKQQFGDYRQRCRSELETTGEVYSGMLSCYEFIPKGHILAALSA
jgi:hypothetical protein